MEAQQQQQQQQYHYEYHHPQIEPLASQSYDPSSQIQSYDQSTQAYYAYHNHPSNHYNQSQQQQQQDYSSYYYDYSTTYQTDPNSIHPPGVPISADSQQTLVHNPHNVYYSHGAVATQQPASHQGFFQTKQADNNELCIAWYHLQKACYSYVLLAVIASGFLILYCQHFAAHASRIIKRSKDNRQRMESSRFWF